MNNRGVFTLVFVAFIGNGEALFGSDKDPELVTFMSVIKLQSAGSDIRLHSHDIKYGSGSGQQSVTGVGNFDDVNSHWQILPANNYYAERGQPIKCGSIIRLMHLTTQCFLHSHNFPAPLSRFHQEISCFGKNGEGSDSGDHYKVVCSNDHWTDDDEIKLKHEDTGKFLGVSGEKYGRPISGQHEVVALSSSGYDALWKAAEGIYITSKI